MKPSEKQFFENAIHNQDENTKIRLAEEGIFLDILLNDESSYVKEAVARQKYRLDVLMYDDDEDVRAVVAESSTQTCKHQKDSHDKQRIHRRCR